MTRATARHAVATGRWSVPFRGTVAVVDVRDGTDKYAILRRSHALHAAGATLRRPDQTVSGRSAAILHGLPTLIVPELAELTTPDAAGLGTLCVHTFGAALTARDVARWFGVPVTDVARSLVDLARHDRRDGLMAGDAALREKLVRPAELAAALDQAVGWPGVRQAREVLALASPKAESPLESLTRLAMHDSGFPTPQLQVEICGYQVDLFLAEQRLVIEADGRGKYTGDELWREKRREHVLRNLGLATERVIWADVMHDWPVTERRLWAAAGR